MRETVQFTGYDTSAEQRVQWMWWWPRDPIDEAFETWFTVSVETPIETSRITLRVRFGPDKRLWFARSDMIDYVAWAETPEATREAFRTRFVATVRAHLREHGHLRRLDSSAETCVDGRQQLRRDLDEMKRRICLVEARLPDRPSDSDPEVVASARRAALRLFGSVEADRLFPEAG